MFFLRSPEVTLVGSSPEIMCRVVDGKVTGIAVHTGARVAAHAGASEVLVSSTVKDLVAGSDLRFEDRGLHKLKGVSNKWRIFAAMQD